MDSYTATFFSHFDALTFHNTLKAAGHASKLMPVPRKISASCGSCVVFEDVVPFEKYEIEAVYKKIEYDYIKIWNTIN